MKYELIAEKNNKLTLLAQVLSNRGIQDIGSYLHVSEQNTYSPTLLDDIDKGAEMLLCNIKNHSKTLVIVDCDMDGYTSAALILNYLHRLFPKYVRECTEYYVHGGKQHGLGDCVDKALEYQFVIVPDAGSNDYEQLRILKENGVDVLILDHHEAPHKSIDAITINPQLDNYPNKSLCGAAVV